MEPQEQGNGGGARWRSRDRRQKQKQNFALLRELRVWSPFLPESLGDRGVNLPSDFSSLSLGDPGGVSESLRKELCFVWEWWILEGFDGLMIVPRWNYESF